MDDILEMKMVDSNAEDEEIQQRATGADDTKFDELAKARMPDNDMNRMLANGTGVHCDGRVQLASGRRWAS
jgi:hypothetical protein